MNLELWKNRLISQCPLVNGQVFLAIELASTEPQALTPPCVFIVPLSEKSIESKGSLQVETHAIAVVSIVKNVADARGEEAYLELQAIRDSVKKSLIHWHPQQQASVVKYSYGSLNYFDDSIVSWLDRFECDYQQRINE